MLVLKTKTEAKAEKVEGEGSGGVALSGSMTRQVSDGILLHAYQQATTEILIRSRRRLTIP